MLFNSSIFIFIFMPTVLLTYVSINKTYAQKYVKTFLVLASLCFYSWWNIIYLPVILISMIFNFLVSKAILSESESIYVSKNSIVTFGVVANLALLGYFKYYDFFIENVNYITNSDISLLNLVLPLAISFFTFQQITFLVDTYKSKLGDISIVDYALFVTFFPQLIAGPIVHHSEMMPQFQSKLVKSINLKNISIGLLIFSIGLFKKVVIADNFAVWANAGFSNTDNIYFIEAWITSLSYTMQLYFDFSGYADMAVGIALMLNIKLPVNFSSPYKSKNIQEFWRSWHMTLSRFLRDYIYIPLGGNRTSEFKVYRNLMITFVLGGIWHGAGWTFIVWGVMHGIALIIHRLWSRLNIKRYALCSWFVTFNFVNIAWIFFRATEFKDAVNILEGMTLQNGINLPDFLKSHVSNIESIFFGGFLWQVNGSLLTLLALPLGIAVVTFAPNSNQIANRFKPSIFWLLFTLISFLVSIMLLNQPSEFLYFNF